MAVPNLVGVVVGGLIGLAGSFIPHWYEKRRARLSARAFARAYISGILKLEEIRKHGSLYQQNIESLKADSSGSLMKIFGAEELSDTEIQKSITAQLGFIEPGIAADLVMFGNMLAGLRIDLKAMTLGQMDSLTASQKIGILQRDLDLWNDTLRLGRDLVQRLA
jgi:hypothetical protein